MGCAGTLAVGSLLRSNFARWWLLMTSGEYGFEREVVEKTAFDAVPVPPLSPANATQPLHDWYSGQVGNVDQDALDGRVARLYGLSEIDCQIIDDTMKHAFGEDDLKRRSGKLDISAFVRGMDHEPEPWEGHFGVDLKAATGDPALSPTWRFVRLGTGKAAPPTGRQSIDFLGLLHAADEAGSTEVHHQADDGRLWIGLPEQAKYWTFSQGLRCARHVVWNHIDFLIGEERDGI